MEANKSFYLNWNFVDSCSTMPPRKSSASAFSYICLWQKFGPTYRDIKMKMEERRITITLDYDYSRPAMQ
jgi:hypothetical protein